MSPMCQTSSQPPRSFASSRTARKATRLLWMSEIRRTRIAIEETDGYPAPRGKRLPLGANEQDRQIGVAQHLVGHAPKHQPAQATAAVGGHSDEGDTIPLSTIQDGAGR